MVRRAVNNLGREDGSGALAPTRGRRIARRDAEALAATLERRVDAFEHSRKTDAVLWFVGFVRRGRLRVPRHRAVRFRRTPLARSRVRSLTPRALSDFLFTTSGQRRPPVPFKRRCARDHGWGARQEY